MTQSFSPALSRRHFLAHVLTNAAIGFAAFHSSAAFATKKSPEKTPFFQTRGVVLTPEDFTWDDWPQAAKQAHLTTIGIHHPSSPAKVVRFIQSETGQKVLEQCQQLHLHIEYELHAMKELLPRERFKQYPEMFRMNDAGERTPDSNLCVSSSTALDIAAENAVKIAQILRPSTHRYFFWGDDGLPWCRCPKCRALEDSDQALLLENHLLKALRADDPQAQLAHLAYANSLHPPKQIKPEAGIFLEYAPINRRYDIPFE
ncbi:MAG: DUF4838 domain-containing protein, partial [Candidatus Hinthialibacter sp.]